MRRDLSSNVTRRASVTDYYRPCGCEATPLRPRRQRLSDLLWACSTCQVQTGERWFRRRDARYLLRRGWLVVMREARCSRKMTSRRYLVLPS